MMWMVIGVTIHFLAIDIEFEGILQWQNQTILLHQAIHGPEDIKVDVCIAMIAEKLFQCEKGIQIQQYWYIVFTIFAIFLTVAYLVLSGMSGCYRDDSLLFHNDLKSSVPGSRRGSWYEFK